MKKINPCAVYYITPSRWMHRFFADKSEAAKWVLKRLDDPKFKFRMIAGSTWEVSSIETVKEWAR